ncbi:MAG: hypothetical protein Q8P56_05540 [Candidatus Uhrbacteria bacterium]|nr:hypothetical protein [Candidatus Uhrbacteria bacterium]
MRIFFGNKKYLAVITLVFTLVGGGVFFVKPNEILSAAAVPSQNFFSQTTELSGSARLITNSCSFDSNQNAPNNPPSILTDIAVGYTCRDYTYKRFVTRAWRFRYRPFTVQAVGAGPNEFFVAQSNLTGASKSNSCWFDVDDTSSNYPPDTTNLPIGFSCNDYIRNDGGIYQWRQLVVQTQILRRYCVKGFCYPSITAKNNPSITQSVPRAFITESDVLNKYWPKVGKNSYYWNTYCVGGVCLSGKVPEIRWFSVNSYYEDGNSTPGKYVDFTAFDLNEFQISTTGTPGFYDYLNGPRCACDVNQNIRDLDCSAGRITSERQKCQDIYKQGSDYYGQMLGKKPIFYIEKVKIDRIDPSQTGHNDYFYTEQVVSDIQTNIYLARSSGQIFATKQTDACSAQIVQQELFEITSEETGDLAGDSRFKFKLSPIVFANQQDPNIWCRVRLASQIGEDVMIYFPPLATVIHDPKIVSFTVTENSNDVGVKTLDISYGQGFYFKSNITGDYDPPKVTVEHNGAVVRTLAYNEINGRIYSDSADVGTYVFRLVVNGRAPALSSQVTDFVTVNVGKASPAPFSFRAGTDRTNLSDGPITVQPGGELFLDWDIKQNGNFVLRDYLDGSEVNQTITDISYLGIRNWLNIKNLQPGLHRFILTQYFDTTQFNVVELSKEIQVTVIEPPPTVVRFTANGAAYATSVEYCKDRLRLDWETIAATDVLVSGPRIDSSLQSKVSQYANGNIVNLRPKSSQSPALYQIIAKKSDLSSSPEPVAVYIDRGVSCFEECLINQAESIFPRAKLLRQNESVKRCVGFWNDNAKCCTGVWVNGTCVGSKSDGYDAQSDDVILCNVFESGTKILTRLAKEPTSAFQAAGVKIVCLLHFASKVYDGEKDQCKGRLPDEDFPVNEVIKNVGDGLKKGALPGVVGGVIGGVIGGVPLPFVSCIPGVAEVVRLFVGFFTGIIGELIGQAAADAFTVPPDPNKLGEGLGYFVGDIVGREMGYELGSSLWGMLDLFGIKIGDIDLDKLGYSCPSTIITKQPPPIDPVKTKPGVPPADGTPSGPGVKCVVGNCQLIVEGTNVEAVNALATTNDHIEVNSVQTALAVKAAEDQFGGVEVVPKANWNPQQQATLNPNKVAVRPSSSSTIGKVMKENPREFTTTVAHIKYNTEKFIAATGRDRDSSFANEFAYAVKKRFGASDGEINKFLFKNSQSGEFSAFVKAAAKCIVDTSSCSK